MRESAAIYKGTSVSALPASAIQNGQGEAENLSTLQELNPCCLTHCNSS